MHLIVYWQYVNFEREVLNTQANKQLDAFQAECVAFELLHMYTLL